MSLEQKIKALLENDTSEVVDTELVEGEAGADNAKIEAGKKNKLEDKKNTGEPSTDEPNNKRNNVDKSPVSEDHLNALVDGEDLSEDFKAKAATILEAAIAEGVSKELDRLSEENEAKLNEAVETLKEDLVEKLDGFLNLVVENWVKENEIAIERGIKTEILENFIDGMKNLFTEYYIDVPDEKLDILDEQATKIDDLTAQIEESTETITALTAEVNAARKQLVVESVGSDLSDTDFERFASLCENIQFSTDFEDKATTILEKYFPKKTTMTESVLPLTEDGTNVKTVETSPVMSKYVEALSGSLKF